MRHDRRDHADRAPRRLPGHHLLLLRRGVPPPLPEGPRRRARGRAMKEVAAEPEQWLATGEPVAIATVVRITGSAPRPLGATLIARAGDKIAGSVSNGCVESAVYEEAMAVLNDGRTRVVNYGISDEFALTVGLSCGGSIDVLVEPVGVLHRAALEAVRAQRGPPSRRPNASPTWRSSRRGRMKRSGRCVSRRARRSLFWLMTTSSTTPRSSRRSEPPRDTSARSAAGRRMKSA